MFTARNIVIVVCFALSVSGCESVIGFPKIEGSFALQSRNEPWPTFLPIETIIGANPVNIKRSNTEIRNLQSRVARLRQKAQLLRAPIIEAQQKLRMQQALLRSLS